MALAASSTTNWLSETAISRFSDPFRLFTASTMDWVNARSFVALGATMATFNVVVPPPDGLPPPLGVPPPPPPLLLHAAATIARTATTAARRAHRNVRLFIPTSPRPGLAPDLRRSLCLPSHPP